MTAAERAELIATIETRLLGVDPDEQDVRLEDHEWLEIIAALKSVQADSTK